MPSSKTRTILLLLRGLLLLCSASAVLSEELEGGGAGAGAADGKGGCPRKCACTQVEIVCRNVGLEEIPDDLPVGETKYTKIDLSQNYIRTIANGYFEALPNLKEVLLDSNGISEINSKAFFNTNIERLSLENNQFTVLPFAALQGLKNSLSFLSLDRNNIETVDQANFAQFKELVHLNLANNLLAKVLPDAFKGLHRLETLKLGNNQIANISAQAFKPTPRLRELDISNNVLKRIPEAIENLPELTALSLSGNRVDTVPSGLLQHCPLLGTLNIQGNPLRNFHHDAFEQLPNLEKLIISEARNVDTFPNLNGTSSLTLIRIDRASIREVPTDLCRAVPNLRSLEMKSNKITELPALQDCTDLRLIDFSHNDISEISRDNSTHPLSGLPKLHDVLLSHNNITEVRDDAFRGVENLQILDLSNNQIENIHEDAFVGLDNLEDINVGVNRFPRFPTKGLRSVVHIKTHNNPNLEDFPSAENFPNVRSLVLSYAYHCCLFLPSTFANRVPDFTMEGDNGLLKESVFFPGDGNFDTSLWLNNGTSDLVWSSGSVSLSLDDPADADSAAAAAASNDPWASLGGAGFNPDLLDQFVHPATPPAGIECAPAPGPFLPCNDLFDWWTLRCSVWIVFLLALLGNGCVVIVLAASRGKMDVPRFLVMNLAMADFFMGLYLGFLAVTDAATLGEFRKYALPWQFSGWCQAAGFFGVLSSELSVFTLAVITLERNYAITHAMHLNKRLSLRHASYIMACGWSFALLMAALPLVGVSDYRKFAVCLPFETGDALSLTYVVFLMFINGVAFSILMGCYLKMYCAIRGSQAWNSNDSRIAKRMALLVFTDFICWAPIAFLALCSSFGLHLISLEQAKVFTIFVLPLNSCCNPFLYAILTKQFKKDCVMICKAIEESRVTRGIGRCRHSSNFSNRQTPANTNSLNSGGSANTGGGHSNQSRGTVCSCAAHKGAVVPGGKNGVGGAVRLAVHWPFTKIKRIFYGYKDDHHHHHHHHHHHQGGGAPHQRQHHQHQRRHHGGGGGGGSGATGDSYTQQIAEIQHKQHKTKRQASLSSDNFSSSRSDSWRHHGHCIPGLRLGVGLPGGGGGGHHNRHRRRNSWTVTRKPSQDSQMSSSRNDSASSNSTNTWRMSRSSVTSDSNSNSVARVGSGYGNVGAAVKLPGGAGVVVDPGAPTGGVGGPLAAAIGAGAIGAAGVGAAGIGVAAATPVGGGGVGKFSALAQRTQARAAAAAAGHSGIIKPSPLARLASDNSALLGSTSQSSTSSASIDGAAGGKPKLIRQAAILADADSGGSHKSVTFQEPLGPRSSCPVHSAEYAAILGNRYRNLYNKLVESNQEDEESDMEASDADPDSDDGAGDVNNGSSAALIPLGTTFRTISAAQAAAMAAAVQPHASILGTVAAAAGGNPAGATTGPSVAARTSAFVPRKLSTISSKGSFAQTRDDDEDDECAPLRETSSVVEGEGETVVERSPENNSKEKTTRAVIEARPRDEEEAGEAEEKEGLLKKKPEEAEEEEEPTVLLAQTRTVTEGKRRYLNTDV